ncbi:MAG: hypothetical protein ACLFM0_08160 [Spirochaetales bacterium]
MQRLNRLFIVILLAFVTTNDVDALSLDLRGGLVWIGNGYREEYLGRYVEGSDVSPLLTFSGIALHVPLGLSFPWDGQLSVAPGVDLWYKDYAFTGEEDVSDERSGRAVPTQIETAPQEGREVAGTLGILLSAPVDVGFPFGDQLVLTTGLSPSVLLRAPINPIEGSDTEKLQDYFYSDLRYLYPELRFGGFWKLSEQLGIHTQLRGFTPVARLLDTEESLPWWDTLMISGQFGLRITF